MKAGEKEINKNLSDIITDLEIQEQKIAIKKMKAIEKAASSDDVNAIIKAKQSFSSMVNQNNSQNNNGKSFFIDPLQFNSFLGYKDKPFSLSYSTLYRMSKTPIINSIIKTRKNQIVDFLEPKSDKYSNGFFIRRKQSLLKNSVVENVKEDDKIIEYLTNFILNCGEGESWGRDSFDEFIRKSVEDSLVYDQMTFECIRNKGGKLVSFCSTDASTYRFSEQAFSNNVDNPNFKDKPYFNDKFDSLKSKMIKGYYPKYVQIYQNAVVSEFYPWELCFAVRNPSSSIHANGYGLSELEELINVVTSLLWSDEYNRRFFSQGSAPKGILRIKGNVNESSLQQFKQQWQAMISGVMQSWKTPILEGDVDWVDLQKNNRDMEYTSWMEYLIKLSCAVYSIDPSEIGWDISANKSMFDGSQREKLQHSKDKGLYPLLKFLQFQINKYIISQINPDFEFVFSGLNTLSVDKELELDIKKGKSFCTINELREKYDMKPIEHGDIISDSIYYQAVRQAEQVEQQKQEQEQGEEENPFLEFEGDENEEDNSDEDVEKSIKNIFEKSFDNFLKQR